MKVLHTSDWHIGRNLYGRKTFEIFEAFFAWLLDLIEEEGIDVLLVAGDVFDSGTPGNRAQELYYRFLSGVSRSSCKHVVIIAGNHDSPSFLNAPRALLRSLEVHVIGGATENPGDEVILLQDENGEASLVVCAVPYLRDKDIREMEAGENFAEKERKMVEGIASHYARVAELAEKKRGSASLPVIAMGHLFTSGGEVAEDDGVRELYIGSFSRFPADLFPELFDYIALGHLHIPQRIGNADRIVYSGSPLPMGFGKRDQKKSLCILNIDGDSQELRRIPVPCFQELFRIEGDWSAISSAISALSEKNSRAWLEILYTGKELMADLREGLDEAIRGTGMEILKVRNQILGEFLLRPVSESESLGELRPEEVFERCLDARKIPEEQRKALQESHAEILQSLLEEDSMASS